MLWLQVACILVLKIEVYKKLRSFLSKVSALIRLLNYIMTTGLYASRTSMRSHPEVRVCVHTWDFIWKIK
eukprot:gene7170-14600_t